MAIKKKKIITLKGLKTTINKNRRMITVVLLCVVLLGFGGYFSWRKLGYKKPVVNLPVAHTTAPVVVRDCTFSEPDMLSRINEVRTHKVTVDPYLQTITVKRIATMPYELDDHVGMRLLRSNGVFNGYSATGEILASNYCPSTNQIFSQWKSSPPHWAAITDERYDVVGIGFNGQSAVVIFGDLK